MLHMISAENSNNQPSHPQSPRLPSQQKEPRRRRGGDHSGDDYSTVGIEMDRNENPLGLASFSLTHVYYNPNDPISHISAWLALLPQALMISYVTLLFSTREIELALAILGQLSCEAINFVLKRLIRESRPPTMLGKGYGMPSSHAQFVAFFGLYFTLLLWARGCGGPQLAGWRKLAYSFVAWTGGWAVSGSRVYLGYHTRKQVLVGYGVGVVCAGVWYVVTAWARTTSFGESGAIAILTGGRRLWDWGMWAGGWVWVRDRCLQVDLVENGWRPYSGADVGRKLR